MQMFEYLSQYQEDVPKWLTGDAFSLANFFASRTVVYPGTGRDGHAIEIFNRSHSTHCFVCIDQDYRADQIRQELAPGSYEGSDFYIRGYDVIFERDLPQEIPGTQPDAACHLCVYERNSEYGDDYGAVRIALLLVGAEAHATYQWLYGGAFAANPPFGLLLQDHGFSGNFSGYTFDDPRSPMVETARINGWPRFIVVGDGTSPWPGFIRIEGVEPSVGGMHGHMRVLYEYGPLGRYAGVYQGMVKENRDPEKRLRLQVEVFEVPGVTGWAVPCLPPGAETLPSIGETVWLLFQGGDDERPVWIGVLPGTLDKEARLTS